MYKTKYVVMVAAIMVLTFAISPLIVSADWNPGDPNDPAKYVQLPDLASTGLDVNATYTGDSPFVKVLADDFLCTTPGPITDIHIWGSWLNDLVDPNMGFYLSIHDDIPKIGDSYSRPGLLRWKQYFTPSQYQSHIYADPVAEQFYDPNSGLILGLDTQVWQYNFYIDPSTAFVQEGSAAVPKVYWLDVQAYDPNPTILGKFGWKTSLEHWNDDAVYGDTTTPGGEPGLAAGWIEMHYPSGHPLQGQSIDLAFAITPEPSSVLMLLGACLFGLAAYIRRR